MNISKLKSIVNNGWTIQNRKTIINQIGKKEFNELATLAETANLGGDIFIFTMIKPHLIKKNAVSQIINYLQELNKKIKASAEINITELRKRIRSDKSLTWKDINEASSRKNVINKDIDITKQKIFKEVYDNADIVDLQKEMNNLHTIRYDEPDRYLYVKKLLAEMAEARRKKLKEMGGNLIPEKNIQNRKFNDEENKIIFKYRKNSSIYNDALRNNKTNTNLNEEIKILDSLIEHSQPLKKECIVYRLIPNNILDIDNLKTGEIITDKAFMSTGTSTETGEFAQSLNTYIDSFIYRINLPAGTKGLDYGCEEFILPRNSKIQINSIDRKLGIIDVSLIL